MDEGLPESLNNRRRSRLYRYTLLAVLSYQLPVGVTFLARFFNLAKYEYSAIWVIYAAFFACSTLALILIKFKKQITIKFIKFILYYQVFGYLLIVPYMIYVMSDLRHLVPLGCLLVLMFVFIQSNIIVSFLTTLFVMTIYLFASYIGIYHSGQPGPFLGEVLYIFIYVPVCLFIAYISKIMQAQQQKIKNANLRLKTTYHALETQNSKMIDSLQYAKLIQRSLLPGIERIKAVSPDSMFIWKPKDIVGGDIFYTYSDPENSIIALMDCTGHGVPGAFLTMIVYSEIRKIIMDEVCRDPAEILKRLNRAVKNVLHLNAETAADDGLDAAICKIDHAGRKVVFAGARSPLFFFKNGELHRENGDKESIGYKDSKDDYIFTNHTIDVETQCSFYLKTDGFTDQLGGEKRRRFGTGKFKELIVKNNEKPFIEQRKIFLQNLMQYQGDHEQVDDITLIGFHL